MNTSIGDEEVRVFFSQFCSSIGIGLSVEKSFDQAKASLRLEGAEEENVPQLFAKSGVLSADFKKPGVVQ